MGVWYYALVVLLLLGGHVHTEDLLHLGGERFFHILFDAPEQEGLQDFVQALVAVISPFPMLILKILPGLKPARGERPEGLPHIIHRINKKPQGVRLDDTL